MKPRTSRTLYLYALLACAALVFFACVPPPTGAATFAVTP